MPSPETDPIPDSPRRYRVLIVEDSKDGLRALGRILTSKGYDVVEAIDGQAALKALEAGPMFDVILADLMLPDQDGREVCRIARERIAPPPVTALLTAWAVDPDRDELDRWGVDLLFHKPLDIRELFDRLRSALEARSCGG